jgi:hypothetical protein
MNFARLLNLRLDQIGPAFLNLLLTPLIFADALVANIQLEWLKLNQALGGGVPLTIGMLVPLIKWVFFLALITFFAAFIVVDSAWHIFFKRLSAKSAKVKLLDLLLLVMVLFLYYFVLSTVIYFFFNILLPMHAAK